MLAFQLLGPHGYFFKKQTVARKVLKWVIPDQTREQLKRKFREQNNWERPTYFQQDEPGHFYCKEDEVHGDQSHVVV